MLCWRSVAVAGARRGWSRGGRQQKRVEAAHVRQREARGRAAGQAVSSVPGGRGAIPTAALGRIESVVMLWPGRREAQRCFGQGSFCPEREHHVAATVNGRHRETTRPHVLLLAVWGDCCGMAAS